MRRISAVSLLILAFRIDGFVFPFNWRCRQPQCFSSDDDADEYDEFALEFEQVLQSSDWSNVALTTGKEISPHYRRDNRVFTDSIADPDGLRRLLQERYKARRVKNFDLVGQIDRQLQRNHGVKAYDHPPIWTRVSEGPPQAHFRRRVEKRKAEMKELYGLLGHPYRQVGREQHVLGESLLTISPSQVHTSLSRRTRCRMGGRYEEADAIRFELSLHGIRIHDDHFEWTVDEDYDFDGKTSSPAEGENHQRQSTYTQILTKGAQNETRFLRFGGRTLKEDELRRRQRMEQLLERRSEALAKHDARRACLIELELHRTYQVSVDDTAQTWWIHGVNSTDEVLLSNLALALGGRNETTHEREPLFPGIIFGDEALAYDSPTQFRQSSQSQPLENESWIDRVQDLVSERINKREEGKFLEADALRRELWHTYNVGVNDRLQQYSVGGVYDED